MDIAERLKDMMVAVGKEADIPIEIDHDQILIAVDDFVECVVEPTISGDAIEFQAPLFAFTADMRARLFEEASKLNLNTEGIAIALSDKAPVLVMRRTVAAEGLHHHELGEALAGFLAAMRKVRERLTEVLGGDGDALRLDTGLEMIRG